MVKCLLVESKDPLAEIIDNHASAHGNDLLPLTDLASRAKKAMSDFRFQERETTEYMDVGNPEKRRYYVVESLNGHLSSELDKCGINPMKYFAASSDSGRFKAMEGMH